MKSSGFATIKSSLRSFARTSEIIMAADNGSGYITELNATDVLFGRGSGPNDHEGNIRFRQLVADRKEEYLATNHRQTKAKIAREIVDTIINEQGRFLKKVEHFEATQLGIPKGVEAWIAVDDDTVMEKAKQALRQNANKRDQWPSNRGTNSPSRGNSPVRGNASPVRNHVSPVPSASPVRRTASPVRNVMPINFDDLEPLPLTNSAGHATGAQVQRQQQFLELQQQQEQLQRQVAHQHAQQQQGAMNMIDPTTLGWQGSANRSQYTTQLAPLSGGDWGRNSNHGGGRIVYPGEDDSLGPTSLWGVSAHGRLQQTNNNMAPPQPRIPAPNNTDVNNWGFSSEHTVPTRNISNNGKYDNEEDLSLEKMRKRRQSLQVEDLMDSFSNLTASEDISAKNQESTDTMGTIEPIGAYDSTNMSVTSFSSSTFSMFKDAMGQSTDSMPQSRGVSRNSSSNEPRPDHFGTGMSTDMMSMQSLNSLNSIGNMSDVWGSRRASLLDKLVQEERERAAVQSSNASGDAGLAEAPRPIGLMEEEPDNLNPLGESSLSVMKAAFESNRRPGVGSDHDHGVADSTNDNTLENI